jgi:hypothetical protein
MDKMNNFHSNPVTNLELIKWKSTPLKNPRTGRKISEKGDIYVYLQNEFDKAYPDIRTLTKNNKNIKIVLPIIEEFKIEDSIDDKDPITLAVFWIQDGTNKKPIYEDKNNLILYKDSRGLIRCFEKDSLEYMKAHNILKHPISYEDIPNSIFENITAKNLEEERKEMTSNDLAFEVFQKFSNISIFIDSIWFMDLSKDKLIKFNYEIKDMYHQNFNKIQMKEISNVVDLFILDNNNLETQSIDEVRKYLLDQMKIILDVKKEDLKYMCNYLLVGSLSVVIPQIRDLYPDFCFSFSF